MSLFGNTNTNTSTPSLFGNTTATSTSLFGNTASNPTQPKPGSLFGTPAAPNAAPTSTLGGNLSTTTPKVPSLFGSKPATTSTPSLSSTPSLFGTPASTASTTPKTVFTLGATPAISTSTSTPSLSFALGGTPSSTPAATSSTTPNTLSLATSTTATPAPTPSIGFTLGATSAKSTIPSLGGKTTTTTTTTPSTATTQSTTYTYKEVEDLINKWSTELEDQERMFMRQANQVNHWDALLMNNAEHITDLNNEVEKVKADQQRLNHDLDFIESQQRELEAILQPLEEKIKSSNMATINNQYSDNEREKTYSLAESIDSQLKQMGGDMKEVIEHLNSVNASANDESNPMFQISKILNMHMDALVWVDQNSSVLQKKVDEVSMVCEQRKQEQEKNFRMAFE